MNEGNKRWFFNKALNKKYEDFFQKNSDIINKEYENDFEKKLAYVVSSLFDNSGISDIENNDIQNSISKKYILDQENDLNSVYYDSKNDNKKQTIILIKYLDIDNIDDLNYEKNISPTMNGFLSIVEKWWKRNNKEKILDDDSTLETIDKIDDVINEINDENLKDDDGRVKKNKISFKLVFIIGNLHEYKNKIKTEISQLKKDIKYSNNNIINKVGNFNIDLYFEEDILENIKNTNTSKGFVDEAILKIDQPNNWLRYSNISNSSHVRDSIVVNISAKSIRNLWIEHSNNLLGMNIRFYVKRKKIDDKIHESMVNENNKEFWIKNNGLVILCEDYKINGENIELKYFSIVNGGQTTYNIGNFKNLDNDEQDDFFVLSKIIAIKNMQQNNIEIIDFANSIAEATNTQKPIKPEDLLSSNKELKKAKSFLYSKEIFLGTKKGESKEYDWIKKEKWRSIDYSKVLQIDAAFYDLIPGNARNAKSKLFIKEKIEHVFGTNVINDFDTLIDLIKFDYVVNNLDKKKKLENEISIINEKTQSNNYSKFVKYAKFFSISLLRVIKIFLEYQESISEYAEIIKSSDFSDSEKQAEITKWSHKWWNRINDKRIFIDNDIQGIENYWKKIIKSAICADFIIAIKNTSYDATNFSKINKSFFQYFMDNVLTRFNENKSKYSENILISKTKMTESEILEEQKIFTFQKGKIKLIDNNSKEVLLLKDSIIPKLENREEDVEEIYGNIKDKLEKWIKERQIYLENNGDSYIVSNDIKVNSSSLAAELVSNKIASYSGPVTWKNQNGQTLKEYLNLGKEDYE